MADTKVETVEEERSEEKFVLTPEIYERSMEKMKVIEQEVQKITGKKCRLMDMLTLKDVKDMRKRADEYKKENPDWQTESLSQTESAWDKEPEDKGKSKVEEVE
jgi:hypothetical protein